jgi:hypothetical protein
LPGTSRTSPAQAEASSLREAKPFEDREGLRVAAPRGHGVERRPLIRRQGVEQLGALEAEAACGEGARLVEDHGADPERPGEERGLPHEHPQPAEPGHRALVGEREGDPERAGAGDHQDGGGDLEGGHRALPRAEVQEEGRRRREEDEDHVGPPDPLPPGGVLGVVEQPGGAEEADHLRGGEVLGGPDGERLLADVERARGHHRAVRQGARRRPTRRGGGGCAGLPRRGRRAAPSGCAPACAAGATSRAA